MVGRKINEMDIKWRGHALRSSEFLRSLALLNCFKLFPKFVQALVISRFGLFDERWLRHSCNLQGIGRYRAALFFARQGGGACWAHPLFDAGWYGSRYGFRGTPAEALLHYWCVGDRIGLRPHAWFDSRLFRLRYALPFWGATALEIFMRSWQRYPLAHPHFELRWYLDRYPDVRLSGQNPLVHYVHFGMREGRQPNQYFIPSWYLEHNSDVSLSGLPAALHFCLYGANELRNPGPDFDSVGYASRHAEMSEAGYVLDPLAHYLITGRAQGADPGPSCLYAQELVKACFREQQQDGASRLDVVIPVYRGLEETRVCIGSVIESESFENMRLRIYNDCSPEPEVTSYLRRLASDYPQIILVENPENLGFVGTVNSAMRAAMESEDFTAVVLLNSDTEVANDWLWRMHWHAMTDVRVASVTALSNNATICSYPHLGANEMPAGMTVADLDVLASSVNAGMSVDVPTGVGFCMLITRQALEELGLFDQDAFGRGYGEENDFCMRALQAGFRNLLALDVFVRHVGEVSFAETSKPGKIVAERVLATRYPDYAARVGAFVARDPSLTARLRLTFSRWRASADIVHVLFTHALGGGTERYVREEVSRLSAEGPVVVVRPAKNQKNRIRIESTSSYDGFDVEVSVEDANGLAALLKTMGVGKVRIHHVLGFGGDVVRRGLAMADLEYDFMVHDYYSICPQITLTTERSRYCGESGLEACDACIGVRPSHGASDIRNWRMSNEWLVSGAKGVYAPSADAAARIERYFGVRPEVRYHESEISLQPVGMPRVSRHDARAPYRVVIIGALANHKGRQVVLDAAEAARKHGYPLQFHLIGDPLGAIPAELRAKLQWTGPYQEQDLARLIEESRADAFLFAATSPETYSYTLSSAIRTGLPIIATAIGAFPERLINHARAMLVPWDIDGGMLAKEIVRLLHELHRDNA